MYSIKLENITKNLQVKLFLKIITFLLKKENMYASREKAVKEKLHF